MRRIVAFYLLLTGPCACAEVRESQPKDLLRVDSKPGFETAVERTESSLPEDNLATVRTEGISAKSHTIGAGEPSLKLSRTRDDGSTTPALSRSSDGEKLCEKEVLVELAPRLSRSTSDLPVRYLPEGQALIDLKGRFSHVLLTRIMPDGSLRSTCVDTIEGVKAWLSSDAKSKKRHEKTE
ncbi:MAG: hypothetical protein JXA30_02415 [Deltaproteobacteria bacterium]|nr:hypothetical protein [Deltaproteobacteria bacterium]